MLHPQLFACITIFGMLTWTQLHRWRHPRYRFHDKAETRNYHYLLNQLEVEEPKNIDKTVKNLKLTSSGKAVSSSLCAISCMHNWWRISLLMASFCATFPTPGTNLSPGNRIIFGYFIWFILAKEKTFTYVSTATIIVNSLWTYSVLWLEDSKILPPEWLSVWSSLPVDLPSWYRNPLCNN